MKLVRAKLRKDLENTNRGRCCSEYRDRIRADINHKQILTLDLDRSVRERIWCSWCGKDLGITHGVLVVEFQVLEPLEIFDLDEAPYVS